MTDSHLELGELIREWGKRSTAPKDGTVLEIAVGCGRDTELGWGFHAFPYPVCWHEGRWCFARTKAPLFPWQQPVRWRIFVGGLTDAGLTDGRGAADG